METVASPLSAASALERRRLRTQRQPGVTELIKQYILENKLRPGDLMPTENELCDALAASRSSVREAIKTLSALDIVEVRHGHGTFVGRMSLNALVESLAFRGMLSADDDMEVLLDLVEVREMLERGLAAQIVAAMDSNLRDELRSITDAMTEKARSGREFFAEDREFHLLLVQPLGNDLVVQLTGAFWDVHSIVGPTIDPQPGDVLKTARAHVAIVDAAVDGDVDRLRSAIRAHYDPIRRRILAAVKRS